MTTRGAMLEQMRRELRRGNTLDADLVPAINTAIGAYRHIRFEWAESRSEAIFDTVANQEFYGAADDEALGRLRSIDYIVSSIGNVPYELRRMRPVTAELRTGLTAGQPFAYTWYGNGAAPLRLYPIPGAVYPVRIGGVFSVAAPATDEEEGNPWMTTAERLIRSRAKQHIAKHRLRDTALADDMMAEAEDALSQLRSETAGLLGTGIVEPFF